MTRTVFAFDLDGTLVDSRDAVRNSYRDAGIQMPDDAWGKPWRSWLPGLVGSDELAQEAHLRKNESYLRRIAEVRPLPLARVLHQLWLRRVDSIAHHDIAVLTGASSLAAKTILGRVIGVPVESILLRPELTPVAKAEALCALSQVYDEGVFWDDDEIACGLATRWLDEHGGNPDSWSVCRVR